MATALAELDPRDITRLRAELCEVIAARLAHPPFFDYRLGRTRVRPLSAARRQEIAAFAQAVSLDPVMRVEVGSVELRRYLQMLLLQYVDGNAALARGLVARQRAAVRADTWHAAGEVQRGLVALASGSPGDFGLARAPTVWATKGDRSARPDPDWKRVERHTQQVVAALARPDAKPAHPQPDPAALTPGRAAGGSGAWAGAPLDHTAPLPALRPAAAAPTDSSPFAALATGSQSALFGEHAPVGSDDRSTGQVPIVGLGSLSPVATPRELSPDLYQLYTQYMSDLNLSQSAESTAVRMPSHGAPSATRPGAPPAGNGAWVDPSASPHYPQPPSDPRSDTLIFDQLRHQVDAYIRLAARSYGVRVQGSDPASALDALRRSGNVDGADLRLAEGILAIADRVCASGSATVEDYRQAFMLYLLYHRARVGA